MKYFMLAVTSIACLATTINAGKDKWAKKAQKQAAKEAEKQRNTAAIAAMSATNQQQHCTNCPGVQNGGCWQCNAFELKTQSDADRK